LSRQKCVTNSVRNRYSTIGTPHFISTHIHGKGIRSRRKWVTNLVRNRNLKVPTLMEWVHSLGEKWVTNIVRSRNSTI
jgi:hypothetical protein